MDNLLPLEQKKQIKKEYRLRALSVFLMLLAVLEIVGSVLLMPSYFFARTKDQIVRAEYETIEPISPEDEKLFVRLKKLQSRIATLVPQEQIDFQQAFSIFLTHLSPSIKISAFTVEPRDPNTYTLIIRGTAVTREALLDFSNAVKAEPSVMKFDIPVSNYAQERDIQFSATVTVSRKLNQQKRP